MPATNRGRQVQFINGINGVSAGGSALVNMPVNTRFHRNAFQCAAVNYTGGNATTSTFSGTITGAATTTNGSGTGCTLNLTVVNGQITAAAVNAGGSGYAANDKLFPVDATGQGAEIDVATVSTGAVATVTLASGGTASPINPVAFFSSIQQLVNGINMRDISPDSIQRICVANGLVVPLGELPLYYTEPFFNVNQQNEVTSWDLFGQSTYALKMQLQKGLVSPSLIGISEFDYLRNVRPGNNGAQIPFLQPVSQHEYSFNVIAGVNKINTIPFDYPIKRLWLLGSTPGNITQFEVYQDGNKVFEATYAQMRQVYEDYGFQFGRANYLNQTYANTATNTLKGQINPLNYFDAAYISDPDQRLYKALTCENSLVLRVYSAVAQSVNIVVESLPGAYAA